MSDQSLGSDETHASKAPPKLCRSDGLAGGAQAQEQGEAVSTEQLRREGGASADAAVDAIVTIAAEGGLVLTWNAGAERLFGYTEQEALHRSFSNLILPEGAADGPAGVCAIALERGSSYEETYRRRKDGTLIAVTATAARMTAPDGRVLGVSVVFRDALQRRRDEVRLRESEQRLRLSLASGRLGPWEVLLSDDRIWLHENTAKIHGFGERETFVSTQEFLARVHPDDREKLLISNDPVGTAGEPAHFEFRIQHPDGDLRWIGSTPTMIRDEQGRVVKIGGVHEDITKLKAEERALRLNEARLKLGVEVSEMGLGEIDYLADAICLDKRAGELFGLPSGELLPRSMIHARFHDEDREKLVAAIARLVGPQGDGKMVVEHRVSLPNGDVHWLHARKHIAYETNAAGERRATTGLLAILDVTERKRADEHLKLLMGELAHRGKNLLSVIQGIARQTFGRGNTDERARVFEERLMSVAACQDLLISADWKGVDLRSLAVGQVSHFLGNAKGRINLKGVDVRVNATAAQAIGMALHELATNATKYGALSNDVGEIDLQWELADFEGKRALRICWQERGGPEVSAPTRKGFGHNVTIRSPMSTLNASIWTDFRPSGFSWEMYAPIESVLEPA